MNEYAAHLEQAEGETFEQNRLAFDEETCPVLEDVEVPKVLGDLLEALAGAVFLDSRFDLGAVWAVFRRLFPNMDAVIAARPKNLVAQLYERFPGKDRVMFQFQGHSPATGKAEMCVTVDGQTFKGIGNNKKVAKEAAAKCALRRFKA